MKYLKDITLMPHQENVVKHVQQLLEQDGFARILLVHSLGSGKTVSLISSLSAIKEKEPHIKILYIVPSSLKYHTLSHINKFTTFKAKDVNNINNIDINDDADIYVASYNFIRSNYHQMLNSDIFNKVQAIVFDEIHNLRNSNSKIYEAMSHLTKKVRHFLGATATPVNNHPVDFANILAIVLPHYNLDNTALTEIIRNNIENINKLFQDRSAVGKALRGLPITSRMPSGVDLASLAFLNHVISKHVNYFDIKSSEHFTLSYPEVIEENIEVPLSKEQEEKYSEIVKQMEGRIYEVLTGQKRESEVADSILVNFNKLRLISNNAKFVDSSIPEHEVYKRTPKLLEIIKKTKEILDEDPENQVVIYSNFRDNTLKYLSIGLSELGIAHELFTGEQTARQKERALDNILSKRVRVLLLSPAGEEGLSLYTVNHLIIVDPHPNPAKQRQVEGRVIRNNSIPRQVKIIRFFAVPRNKKLRSKKWLSGIDWYIARLAQKKEERNEIVYDILQSMAKKAIDIDELIYGILFTERKYSNSLSINANSAYTVAKNIF
jgi:SNF2 family DNA or RNA helicase